MSRPALALALGRPEAANALGVGLTRWTLDAAVSAAGFTADGAHAGFGLTDGSLRLVALDRFGARRMVSSIVHDGAVRALAPDPLSGGLLTVGSDGRVAVIGGDGFACDLYEPRAHDDAAVAVTAAGPRRVFATSRTVTVLTGRGTTLPVTPGHPIDVLAISPGGDRLAAAGGGRVTLWRDLASPASHAGLDAPAALTALAWSPDGTRLAAAAAGTAAPLWHLRGDGTAGRASLAGRVTSVAWSACGRFALGAGRSGLLCWRAANDDDRLGVLAPARLAPRDGCAVSALAGHPRHPLAAVGFRDGCVMLADLTQGRDRVVRHADGHAVTALAWSPPGNHLACAGADATAALFDFSSLTGKR